MRPISIILLALALAPAPRAAAQCVLPVSVSLDEAPELPAAARAALETQLLRAATDGGVSGAAGAQFVLTARVEPLQSHVVAGPPAQVSARYGFTLFVADVDARQKYASTYIEVSAVGRTDDQCCAAACRQLGTQRAKIAAFLDQAKRKVKTYYDTSYQQIIASARQRLAAGDAEGALALVAAVPPCTAGGDAATAALLDIYAACRDRVNQKLLVRARTIWTAADGDRDASAAARAILATIDPEASCYPEAMDLASEMKLALATPAPPAAAPVTRTDTPDDTIEMQGADPAQTARAVGTIFAQQLRPAVSLYWLN